MASDYFLVVIELSQYACTQAYDQPDAPDTARVSLRTKAHTDYEQITVPLKPRSI